MILASTLTSVVALRKSKTFGLLLGDGNDGPPGHVAIQVPACCTFLHAVQFPAVDPTSQTRPCSIKSSVLIPCTTRYSKEYVHEITRTTKNAVDDMCTPSTCAAVGALCMAGRADRVRARCDWRRSKGVDGAGRHTATLVAHVCTPHA